MDSAVDISADVCIVGAGPVGITIGKRFIEAGCNAVILESGDLDYTKSLKHPLRVLHNHMLGPQEMSRGQNAGQPYTPLNLARARAFGGSSRVLLDHGLQSRPLDPIDFERRDEFEFSGWPLTRADLDHYYAAAHELCGLGPYDYDASRLETQTESKRFPFDPGHIETTVYRFAPRSRFAEYADDFRTTPSVELITDATVVALEVAADGKSVVGVTTRSRSGEEFRVSANAFVLATGAIENARILLHLLADPAGRRLIEAKQLVGAFFMEHPQVLAGVWHPTQGVAQHLGIYGRLEVDGDTVMGQLRLTDEVLRQEGLLNGTFEAVPHSHRAMAPPVRAAQLARKSVEHRFPIPGVWRQVPRAVAGAPTIAAHVMDRLRGSPRDTISLTVMAEQEPNSESRVRLGRRHDRMGLRRPVLDWRLTSRDTESIRSTTRVISAEVERLGMGRVESLVEDEPLAIYGNWHHMGTTRMDTTPERGVVDTRCRVHGSTNLFVAGSSVFPTGGCSNPTLTAVALALRLADHLVSDDATCD